MKRKKVALITPSLAKGGLEKVVVVSATELEKKYDITVIVMDGFRTDYPYDGKIIDLGLSWENRNILSRLYNFMKAVWRLRQVKKENDFDVVIGHGELASFPNILSGGNNNVVVVHENRFAAIKDLQGKVVNQMLKHFFSAGSVSKVVTVSEGIKESFIKQIGMLEDDVVTIYNPYNIEEIKKLSQESIEPYQDLFLNPVLVVAGRLIRAKGQWYMLRIFSTLKQMDTNLKLVILGEGVLEEKLITMSEKLGLKTYSVWDDMIIDESYDVYFMGFQKNPFKFIAASKLFAMTSVWEGFGNTIVEAMACKTPVISADCPSGPGEIISPSLKINNTILNEPDYNGFGVLMPMFDNVFVEAEVPLNTEEILWVDTLHHMLDNDKMLMKYVQKGLKRAEDFNTESIMFEWKSLIDDIILQKEKR